MGTFGRAEAGDERAQALMKACENIFREGDDENGDEVVVDE
jgi:hypothetical protein